MNMPPYRYQNFTTRAQWVLSGGSHTKNAPGRRGIGRVNTSLQPVSFDPTKTWLMLIDVPKHLLHPWL